MGQKNGYQRIVAMGNLGKDCGTQEDAVRQATGDVLVGGHDRPRRQHSHRVVQRRQNGRRRTTSSLAYLKKGKGVLLEGKLKTTSREDEHGQKKYWTTLWADSLTLLPDGNGNGQSGKPDDDVPVGSEDEIPF